MERGVLVVGEALVDVVHARDGSVTEHPGGSAANVAVALARLGTPVRLATSFADDGHGRLIAEHLRAAGVDLASDPHVVDRTSTAVARLGAGGSAEYEFDLDWRLGPPSGDRLPAVVHVCSLGAVLSPGAEAVRALAGRVPAGGLVSYDVNARPAVTGTGPDLLRQVETMAGLADLVKASDEDLAVLYPGLGMEEAARALLDVGAQAVAVTCGEQGAAWFGGVTVRVPSHRVRVVDTIGAGDTFAAALIDSLLRRDRIEDLAGLDERVATAVLTDAVRAAAITVSRAGADPPYRSELA
ncbi:MAG: carbohydrate kinase family protein [Nocardioides sp.]